MKAWHKRPFRGAISVEESTDILSLRDLEMISHGCPLLGANLKYFVLF